MNEEDVRWAAALDPYIIANSASPRHIQSVLEAARETILRIGAAVAAQPEAGEAVGLPCDTKGCACRWDKEDIRVQTCERHQGWLEVVHEWAERAKEAERQLASAPTIQPTQPVQPEQCPICFSDEPYTGTCGSNDPRALCKRATPAQAGDAGEPSDGERLAFIAESKSGTIRLDGDGYNPDDFRAFAPVYVHWNAPQPTLRDAIDAAIRATKGGKL